MTNDFLDFDVRLLILRYGRTKVLETLARIGDQTPDELQGQLQALVDRRTTKAKRATPSILDLVAAETQEHNEGAGPLRTLALAFDNRTFLPQLRDVQRFLDRVDIKHGKLKSRAAAAPLVIRALAKLSPDGLARLIATEKTSSDSEYAVLARAIMGSPEPKPPDSTER